MTTMDTASRPRRGARPTSVSTYAIGTYPAFADDPRCACRGHNPGLFFPEAGDSGHRAKAICSACPLLDRCRDWAIAQGAWVHGVWGGTTHRERKQARLCRTERRNCGVCRHGTGCQRATP